MVLSAGNVPLTETIAWHAHRRAGNARLVSRSLVRGRWINPSRQVNPSRQACGSSMMDFKMAPVLPKKSYCCQIRNNYPEITPPAYRHPWCRRRRRERLSRKPSAAVVETHRFAPIFHARGIQSRKYAGIVSQNKTMADDLHLGNFPESWANDLILFCNSLNAQPRPSGRSGASGPIVAKTWPFSSKRVSDNIKQGISG